MLSLSAERTCCWREFRSHRGQDKNQHRKGAFTSLNSKVFRTTDILSYQAIVRAVVLQWTNGMYYPAGNILGEGFADAGAGD